MSLTALISFISSEDAAAAAFMQSEGRTMRRGDSVSAVPFVTLSFN